MKVLVIPDVHLKPNMFTEATIIYRQLKEQELSIPENERQRLCAVCLGDLVDDWDKQDDLELYRDTFDAATDFVKTFDDEVFFCIGNHDISYVWQRQESGYSIKAESLVRKKMKELKKAFSNPEKFAFVHCIDNTIFSHAGISAYYVMKHAKTADSIEQLIYQINHDFGEAELWMDDSPIWVRMQGGYIWPFRGEYFQVVGHTPVEKPLFIPEQGLLSLDTFSTAPGFSHTPIGDCRYVVVDTVKKTFQYADELVDCSTICT